MSRRLRWLNWALRASVKPRLRKIAPDAARRDFERAAKYLFRRPGRLVLSEEPDTGLFWLRAGPVTQRRVIYYLHGGAYIVGSPRTHQGMIARLSRLTGIEVCAPRYRLAPENPAPAAFDDARAGIQALFDRGYRPQDIILAGDSAGGGLALALLAQLCAEGLRPRAVVAFSPWTDLAMTGVSLRTNARSDALLPSERMDEIVKMVLGGASPLDPRISPLYARFDAPPPVLLQYSQTEILRDDTVRMAARLQEQGADVQVQRQEDAPHVVQIFDGWVPEARAALRAAATFIQASFDDTRR